MKRSVIVFLVVIFSASEGDSQDNRSRSDEKDTRPEIKFEKTIHDFGKIKYHGDGTCSFKFENTGEEPLAVIKVRGDCGCIIPAWTKEPIKSGGTGTVEVEYNTRIVGYFSKTIRVQSNARNSLIILTIKGEVSPVED